MDALNIEDLAFNHNPIIVRMSKTYVKDKVTPKKVRNFKNYTPERLVSNLAAVVWDDVYVEQDINVAISTLTSNITKVLDTLCPLHHRKFVSARTHSLMVDRDKEFKKWKTMGDQLHFVQYKVLRNEVTKQFYEG